MSNKILLACIFSTALFNITHAQYIFQDEINIPSTCVKNQQASGTCWSFGTTSFLESEIIRLTEKQVDISEMYSVRMAYFEKAQNYILRQGMTNFSEGGLSHDVFRNIELHGVMPQSAYTGLVEGDTSIDHGELSSGMKGYLDAVIKNGHPGRHWNKALEGILDAYMGPLPFDFTYENKNYDPMSFADLTGIRSENYFSVTSFNHHPFHRYFILEIPDNYMNGSYFNVKLDEMVSIIDYALEHGYSVLWDGDVGEKGFSQKEGVAVLPVNPGSDSIFTKPGKEIVVTQENRQAAFMSYRTTEDHLMHLVGWAKDQNGEVYYIIKNSWGERGTYKGFLYMSLSYLKMKTVSITVYKDGIPKEILKVM